MNHGARLVAVVFFGSCGLYAEKSSRYHSRARALARSLRWFDHRLINPVAMPPALRAWLLAEGSLTQHLLRASGGDFRVERITQRWQRPTLSEAQLLGIDSSRRALIREVVLWGRGARWVYARSVIPLQSMRGDLRRLRQLRNTSLGALLFKYPHLQRTPFELARVDAALLPAAFRTTELRTPELGAAESHSAGTLWGRRSRFQVGDRKLIVGEIFLDALAQSPALMQLPPRH